ncbi:MAG: YraN family protein [Elusimicrobia bacterium]|nr:YraN family protein [Elusimicrobiota bacterium]
MAFGAEVKNLGALGEEQAAAYLKKLGWKIIARGYKCYLGELDIVAMDGKSLVFVEVKTRGYESFGGPVAAVTKSKQSRVARAALAYIKEKRVKADMVRFDIVAIISGEKPLHIKNAFSPSGFSY